MWSVYKIESLLALPLRSRMQSIFINGSCLLEKSIFSPEIQTAGWKTGFCVPKIKLVNGGTEISAVTG